MRKLPFLSDTRERNHIITQSEAEYFKYDIKSIIFDYKKKALKSENKLQPE